MNDDIVTRLREIPAVIEKLGYEWVNDLDSARLVVDAADEIERLREELQASQDTTRAWIKMLGKLGNDDER
jgi:hypothetical protein